MKLSTLSLAFAIAIVVGPHPASASLIERPVRFARKVAVKIDRHVIEPTDRHVIDPARRVIAKHVPQSQR